MITLRPQTVGKCCLCGGSVLTLSSGKSGLDDMFYMYIVYVDWNEMLISKLDSESYKFPDLLYVFAVGNFEEILETRRM
jgi:hypothetical protein